MKKAPRTAVPVRQSDLFEQERNLVSVPDVLWEKLAASDFRRKFHLSKADIDYLESRGLWLILDHGAAFISRRLAPSSPRNDGRQTPWRGHPVFVAQHATGTCCRSCLLKWHGFKKDIPLTTEQQDFVLAVIAGWLRRELDRNDGR